ncbi:hypothetical protein [Teredinibacter haidensis]|uniref:hypothetical protein n=1 Tax=Teredinibacter haidensis TaxID=2731755 RepID=UPI000948A58F|nr:hypothetical protein [Teredinibacter haidensis]
MNRREIIKLIAAGYTLPVGGVQLLANSAHAKDSLVQPLKIELSTAGRIGFYIDYSELTSPGTHTFFVYRTHGTEGKVSVKYQSRGDSHDNVSGELSWENGEANIQKVEVNVPEDVKAAGEHRIWLELTEPSGEAKLHFGDATVAYGVIDDDTIAPDVEAVFFDTTADNSGDGTQKSPYNNIYDAIANVNTKRYIYGRGLVISDGTNDSGIYRSEGTNCIKVPATRNGEATRLIIRNWPGYKLSVEGKEGSKNCIGFLAKKDESYHTFKNIDFKNLDASDVGPSAGIWHHYAVTSGCKANTVEGCSFEEINGHTGTNSAGISPYGWASGKIWRCTFDRVATAGNYKNQNTAGVLVYNGKGISVQRCEFKENMYHGVYQKRIKELHNVSASVKFSVFNGVTVYYGNSGSSGESHSYTIVQNNVFIGGGTSSTPSGIKHKTENSSVGAVGEKQWWCNNVFYRCGYGEDGAINFVLANKAAIFNNIFYECRRAWREYKDYSDSDIDIEFADYNCVYGTTYKYEYEWRSLDISYASKHFDSLNNFVSKDIQVDPLFEKNSFRFLLVSPCYKRGVSGTDMGVYLTGREVIGVSNEEVTRINPIQKMGGERIREFKA